MARPVGGFAVQRSLGPGDRFGMVGLLTPHPCGHGQVSGYVSGYKTTFNWIDRSGVGPVESGLGRCFLCLGRCFLCLECSRRSLNDWPDWINLQPGESGASKPRHLMWTSLR